MLDRKSAPPYIQSTSFDLIEPDQKKLINGVDLFFIPGGSQDVLRIELVFWGGRWFDSVWGSSYFASHLLSKGTSLKSSFEIAQIFDRYGAHLEANAGLDIVSVSLYSLASKLTPVLNLLKEIMQDPVFPEKELSQAKSIYAQNLKVNYEKTSFLASKYFRKAVFGDGHPYGRELNEKDITTLKQIDLVTHFKKFFQSFSVFVSGKIDRENEKQIVEVFSSWDIKKTKGRAIATPNLKPDHQRVEKKESVQSSVRVGRRSLLRTDPDYTKATFAVHILGGYFGSRLMKNIREEKGLSYGIYASLHTMKQGSYLVIGADVNKENVNITFDEIRKELKRMRTESISADELETSRNHFIGSLQAELTTSFAHADKWKTIYLHGLSPAFYQEMISTIYNIRAEEILEISEKYFHEDEFSQIAVG